MPDDHGQARAAGSAAVVTTATTATRTSAEATVHKPRIEGLDLARFFAFAGMVIVNFEIVMGTGGSSSGIAAGLQHALHGRAAATFVVLAGVGLGMAHQRGGAGTVRVTLLRAVFLLVVGLVNMLVFPADILHYYAFYFAFGVLLLPRRTLTLVVVMVGLNLLFVGMTLLLDYDAGWHWPSLTYRGFWTPAGFARNLFFNGWHPVVPWLGFLAFGVVLSRLDLRARRTQHRMIWVGGLMWLGAQLTSGPLAERLATAHPDLAIFATTDPVPPMPLYFVAGAGFASLTIGVCLRTSAVFERLGALAWLTPTGRQTLTLYVAHILLGMGTLDGLGLVADTDTAGQSAEASLFAAAVFITLSVLYARLWSARFNRGPLELVMRKVAG